MARSTRVRRAWARLALVSVVATGAAALSTPLVLDEDGGAVGAQPAAPAPGGSAPAGAQAAPAPGGPTPAGAQAAPVGAQQAAPARATPRSVGQVLAQDAQVTTDELSAWVRDEALAPEVRYAALRRLEEQDPTEAVSAALAALTDVAPLVRLNAIALLTRASDPRATAALERLDGRSLQLAQALRRGR